LFNEEQLSGIVENQAQKIVDLETKIASIKLTESSVDPAKKGNDEKLELPKKELLNETAPIEKETEKTEKENIANSKKENEITEDSLVPVEENSGKEIIVNDSTTLKCNPIMSEAINTFSENGSFEHLQYGEISVIEINISRATLEIAASLRNFLNRIVSEKYNKVIVDMSNCDFVDSTILGVLVSTLKKARGVNGDLKIVWCDQEETSMFYVTRMDKVFMIYDNLKDAVRGFF
jgi:anti-anti-sigma factor